MPIIFCDLSLASYTIKLVHYETKQWLWQVFQKNNKISDGKK